MIYFVQAQGAGQIKIGYSKSVDKRIESLRTSCPFVIELLGWMPGGPENEKELHRRFQVGRIIGEWFRPTLDLFRFVTENARDWPSEASSLFELEPLLKKLLWEARSYHCSCDYRFCANLVWCLRGHEGQEGIKRRMARLVGASSRLAALRTKKAYDLAYEAIYQALPNCRNCGCPSVAEVLGERFLG